MRTCFILFVLGLSLLAEAQSAEPKSYCGWIEVFIKSAINKFEDAKYSTTPTRQYEEDYEMDGIYQFEEYTTRFLWPGSARTYLQVSTSDDEKEQELKLISPYEPVDTKEKAYAQLKKLYDELTPCTVTPLPGQKAQLKGVLPALANSMSSKEIMNSIFTVPGGKRRVRLSLGIEEKDKKFFAEMQVSIMLLGVDVVVSKCDDLRQVINQFSTNFSGQLDELEDSRELDLGMGLISEIRTWVAKNKFPGSSGTWIENDAWRKSGKIRNDNWSLQAWYTCYSYEEGVLRYKKLFDQLLGCKIQSPANRSITLTATYKEPPKDKRSFIDFATSTEADPFFISISIEKEDDRYFVWLKVSKHTKYK